MRNLNAAERSAMFVNEMESKHPATPFSEAERGEAVGGGGTYAYRSILLYNTLRI
jgi:hypothetical protein